METHLYLVLDQLFYLQNLTTNVPPLRFDIVVLQATATHQLVVKRINYFQQIVKKNLVAYLVSELPLLIINKASTLFYHTDDFHLVLEVLAIKSQDIQQYLTIKLLTILLEVEKVSRYHHEKTVRTDSTFEVLAVSTHR